MAYKGMGGTVKVPKKIKTPQGTNEELIYATKGEIQMLKDAGGADIATPYDGVRSFPPVNKGGSTGTSTSSTSTTGGGFNPSGDYSGASGGYGGTGGSSSNTDSFDIEKEVDDYVEEDLDTYTDFDTHPADALQNLLQKNDNNNDNQLPTFNTSNLTETIEWDEKDGVTLQGLYNNQDSLSTYLDSKKDSTAPATRTVPAGYTNSGDTYTVQVTTKGDPRANDIETTDADGNAITIDPATFFKKDRDGNIIGWHDKDNKLQHDNNDHWHVDEKGRYFYVGEGAVQGAGGEGSTTIIDKDGKPKTVGARTYASLLGYDEDLLKKAVDERASIMEEMGAKQDYYGGVYDPKTGKFTGGLEKKYLDKSEKYGSAYDKMFSDATGYTYDEATGEWVKSGTSEYDRLTKKSEDEYGRLSRIAEDKYGRLSKLSEDEYSRLITDAEQTYRGLASKGDRYYDEAGRLAQEQTRLATDDGFYSGLQSDIDSIRKDQRTYRGNIDSLAEEAKRTPRGMQNLMYAQQADQISRDNSAQKKNLTQMLTQRGVSPTSPVALRMMSALDTSTAEQKRGARRQSLFDAMQMRDQRSAVRSQLYDQASGMTQSELSSIKHKAGIRDLRIGALGQAHSANIDTGSAYSKDATNRGAMLADMATRSGEHYSNLATRSGGFYGKSASQAGAFYTGLGEGKQSALLRSAGMQAAQGQDAFSRSFAYGGLAHKLNEVRLGEAMDRQYGQEHKLASGLSLGMSKWGQEKSAELAEKIAQIQAQGNAQSSNTSGNRKSFLGSLAGGAVGFWLGKGNPYATMTGANWGSEFGKGWLP